MAQQTQVDRVVDYYQRFLRRWPTVQSLARARRSTVVKAWSGLGYNNRAVRMHLTAQQVTKQYGGKFPKKLDELTALPGVGDYTAAAILCFAYQQAIPALDVNQKRILSRYFGGTRSLQQHAIESLAIEVLPPRQGYTWNQALMDFGAQICTSTPHCLECPVRSTCLAYPAILNKKKAKKNNTQPFVGSNRYFRGRIIAVLRKQSVMLDALLPLIRSEHPITKKKLHGLVRDLQRDSLLILDTKTGVIALA